MATPVRTTVLSRNPFLVFPALLAVLVGIIPAAAFGQDAPPGPGTSSASAEPLPSGSFAVEGVRLFDGSEVLEGATVLVRDGRVTEVGIGVHVSGGVPVVAGEGRTLLPGFVDAHVHTFDPAALIQALALGVTVQLDMFTAPDVLSQWRQEQVAGQASHRADILGPGYLATAAGGHGTQYGMPVPTVDAPVQAGPWVAARVEEGADYIKIVLEDGSAHGLDMASLDDAILQALVEAAHAHGLKAVVHVSTLADAERALEAGADGLVHLWVDRVPSEDFVRRMAEAGMFVVPTLTVLEGMLGGVPGGDAAASLLDADDVASLLGPSARQGLSQSLPRGGGLDWEGVKETVQLLRDAGVPLLTGSDAPNPGTTFGASVHRELELLVQAGVTPLEALQGATSAPADAFVFPGGRVQAGAPANLLLVEGDPTTDILATRRILGVWKEGRPLQREEERARVAELMAAAEAPAPRPGFEGGRLVVGDFEDGTLASALGTGWSESTDAMAGGRSTATLEVVRGGRGGSRHALRVTGEVAPGPPFAWAGAFYSPGSPPFSPVDLSEADGVAFHIRGQGPGFQVMVFSRAGGQLPATISLEVGEGWEEVFLPWSAFPGVDPTGITGLLVGAGPDVGSFTFHLDRVELRRATR